MPKNPFKAFQEYVRKTPRNSFDHSFRNNLTLPVGLLVPDLVLDVTAGDSMSLDAAFAFNIDPMVYPVQTPIRITQYFFYVPYRITWENYEDYRYNNKPELVHPYLAQPASFWKTGTLADYMGIPTTISQSGVGVLSYSLGALERGPLSDSGGSAGAGNLPFLQTNQGFSVNGALSGRYVSRAEQYFVFSDVDHYVTDRAHSCIWLGLPFLIASYEDVPYDFLPAFRIRGINYRISPNGGDSQIYFNLYLPSGTSGVSTVHLVATTGFDSDDSVVLTFVDNSHVTPTWSDNVLSLVVDSDSISSLNDLLLENGSYDLFVCIADKINYNAHSYLATGVATVISEIDRPADISENTSVNPFYSALGHSPALKINALPFRAYEQICNCYFRNDRVDPFTIGGEVEYNKFGTTVADGADTTPYALAYRNWELDMLTSCLLSPQQGTAPIVGVDMRHITFEMDGEQYRFAFATAEDGNTVTGGKFESEDVPGAVRRSALDVVANGFTIDSLRNANSLQLYLEKNIRRGLRYVDQHMAHTGIDLSASLLDEPEFLGGFSHYVDVRSVTSASATQEAVLGEIAGQASAFKRASHKINRFFKEDGVVIGLICITPEPVYSQLLPKFYLRTSPLDYYNSEFSHLGMQPVPYAEVAPVQMCAEIAAGGTRNYQTAFGYNRPNYDMVSRQDEVHGNMRTTDRNYVMMRTFEGVPELGADFIKVKGEHLNDVFQITDPNAHIAKGQVSFRLFMKRPVPSVGEPRLQ